MPTEHRLMRVRVTARDADTLRALLREKRPGTGGGHRHGPDGTVSTDAYVPEPLVDGLRREGVRVEVIEDATATGRARQAEVGQGNRFTGADTVPTGLGDKVEDL
jgi:hypothetical protein